MKLKIKLVSYVMTIALIIAVPLVRETVETKAVTAYLNYASCTMTEGYSFQLKVMGTSKKTVWSTSNKKVATVKKGKVTGTGKGKCTIYAKVDGQKLKCKITVKAQPANKKAMFKKTTLDVLELKLDKVKVRYEDDGSALLTNEVGTFNLSLLNKPKNKKVVWTTSNKKIATVKNGKVTAVEKGKCTITAKVGKNKYKCKVVVTNLNDSTQVAKQENIYMLLKLMNKDRVKAKVAPLKINSSINKVADIRVTEIVSDFKHTRPDGTPYSTAYKEVGLKRGSFIGENIAYASDKVEYVGDFVKATYNSLYSSKEHKKNMVNPGYKEVGISYYNAGTYYGDFGELYVKTYWTQEFYTK